MSDVIQILTAIHHCLGGVSIRSLLYAMLDVYVRSGLEAVNYDKVLEIIAQNLAGFLKTDVSTAREIVRNAIVCTEDRTAAAQPTAVGSVGVEKSPTLAHLVNKHVPVDASPRVKLEVVRRLSLPRDVLGDRAMWIYGHGGGHLDVKTAVRAVRDYYPSAPLTDVDFIKTAIGIRRKQALSKPISHRDIYIREYVYTSNKPIYVALDVSGSMKEYVGTATKLKIAKEAIARYIRQISRLRSSISLVLFNTEADFMWTPHYAHRYWREMLEILEYVYASGGTELASTLELLHARGVSRDVVVISDGRTADVEKTVELAGKFKRLHLVATEPSDFLRRLAKITGGRYRELSPKLDIYSLYS